MSIAFWCVLIAIFLPYVGTSIAKFTGGGFGPRQNHDPRTFLASLEGYRKRANAFQMNSFEVTPAFAAAVIIAYVVNNAEPATISRLLYLIFYIADLAMLRSLAWFLGMALIIAIFVVSA